MEHDSILGRIGIFFILLGGVLIGLFVLSDLAGKADAKFLLYGVGGVLLGFILRWTSPRREKTPANRFRLFRARKEKKPRRGLFAPRRDKESDDISRTREKY